jgi:predicted GNAT family N-acyltransferase
MNEVRIRLADWSHDATALKAVRWSVFVEEQGVPAALEWDSQDAGAQHLLAEDSQGRVLGTTRLLPDGHIGRMAVIRAWRRRGLGSLLLQRALQQARHRGLARVAVNAQTYVMAFYERHGFVAEGEGFVEAGIPHHRMTRAVPE